MRLVDLEEFLGMEFSKSSSHQTTTFGSFVPASSSRIYRSASTLYERCVSAFVISHFFSIVVTVLFFFSQYISLLYAHFISCVWKTMLGDMSLCVVYHTWAFVRSHFVLRRGGAFGLDERCFV